MFCACIVSVTNAQVTITLKIVDGSGVVLKGESTLKNHPNEILAESYGQDNSANCSTGSSGSGGGVCKAVAGNFIFNIPTQAATLSLKQYLFQGKTLKSLDAYFIKPGETPFDFYKIHLDNITVKQVTEGYTTGNRPTDQVAFSAQKITWTYYNQKPDGTVGSSTTVTVTP